MPETNENKPPESGAVPRRKHGISSLAGKGMLLAIIIGAVAAFFIFDLRQYVNLEALRQWQVSLASYRQAHGALVLAGFFATYLAVAALSLPGAAILTLGAGAIFGLTTGTLMVSFASSIGATLAFLMARYVLGHSLQRKYGDRLEKINRGLEKDGAFYLFAIRLVPVFPFFVVNLLMGLTRMKPLTFYWVSQLGMLPGTLAYVYAGTQLAKIENTRDILSPGLIAAFIVLGLLPLVMKKLVAILRRGR